MHVIALGRIVANTAVAVMVAIVGECVVQTPVMVGVGLWPTQLTIVAVMGMYDRSHVLVPARAFVAHD